jgi:hypothetical protein
MNKYSILRLAILTTALLAPAMSSALSLGEIYVQSFLGQPFRATIPIQANRGEEIDSDCLVLSPPPAENDMVFLRRATLSVTSHGNSSQLQISGHFPLDEPYLKVVIDLGCKDQGHLIREYTVLIDPPANAYQPALSPLSGKEPHSPGKIKNSTHSRISKITPAHASKKKNGQAFVNSKSRKTATNHRDQLKVLSGSGEKPAQPGLSETERLQQREKELMKELDDKTAKHLEMQAQLGKLESKLVEMQKMLERQNLLLASLQQAPAPAEKTSLRWNNDYWLAGSFVLVGGLGYFLARRSRKQSMENWQPTMRDPNTSNSKIPVKKPF